VREFWCSCTGLRLKKTGSRGSESFLRILGQYYIDEIRAAALKSKLDGPPQAPGPDSDFALISHARSLGYIEREGDVFKSFYLIEPFALGGGPGLLFGSFAGKGYRLKSGQSL
jgi:hypothetical protein